MMAVHMCSITGPHGALSQWRFLIAHPWVSPEADAEGLNRIRVVLADDAPAMLLFLEELLAAEADIDVVALAADTDAAIRLTKLHQPDVVVLDVRMPGGGGEVAARAIRATLPNTRIVGLSSRSERAVMAAMLAAGADCYVVKGPDVSEILRAIRHQPAEPEHMRF
jgi:DNA-binding NarL/FixJ family response regulator